MRPNLVVGHVDDPLEREADRAAVDVLRTPDRETAVRRFSPAAASGGHVQAAASGGHVQAAAPSPSGERSVPAIVHSVLDEPGRPLEPGDRAFFEPRFGRDFADVRVHTDQRAAQSAAGLAARAWTAGHHVVFGRGSYSPSTPAGRALMAHELAHVVQQGSVRPAILRRSPLSDSVKAVWTADPTIEGLLARLSKADVQGAQQDAAVDAELARILAARPDDLWVAQRVRQGRLGNTTGAFGPRDKAGQPVARPIQAVFVRGTTERRALVIAGVHGTERQGMEVARMLIHDLQTQQPRFTVIVVPSLFPDNAASGPFGTRESGATPTNRNFPPPSEDLAAARAAGGGTAVDASRSGGRRGRAILPENVMLLELIERFHPERIISIHGTHGPGSAGVFYDQRTLQPADIQAAREWAAGNAYMRVPPDQQETPEGQERLRTLEQTLFQQRLAELSGCDRELSAAAATQIDTKTRSIPGRDTRDTAREGESKATVTAQAGHRQAHPSVAGNVGPSGTISNFSWSGSTPGGVSLGSYAPPRGISVFTVEPPINRASTDYPTTLDRVSAADRLVEQQAYADAVRTVLLGQP
jgi:hypothetical protein